VAVAATVELLPELVARKATVPPQPPQPAATSAATSGTAMRIVAP
jgi:hypothetical protein